MIYLVIPVQIGKCPLFMARMSVEGTRINILACKKAERSDFVALDWIALQARFCGLLVFWAGGGGFGDRGIFQRPLVRLRWLVVIMLPSLIILTLYLEKISKKSLLQSCLIYMREPVLRLLKMWPYCAWSEIWRYIWSAEVCAGVI